jgi:alpha-ketoglutarate-dependent taurine dioxygenase
MSGTTPWSVNALAPHIGSEIRADVPAVLAGAYPAQIRQLLEERGVVAFRELNLTDLPYAFDSGRMMHRTKLQGEEPFS